MGHHVGIVDDAFSGPRFYYTEDAPFREEWIRVESISGPASVPVHRRIQAYSTDIAAAWEVLEKIISDGGAFTLLYDHGWFANKEGFDEGSSETTAPHAICLAALKAVGVVE